MATAKPHCYDYPRPALTVDVLLFAVLDERLSVLLIQRKGEPFRDRWAIPGGFVEMNEDLEAAARRELREETGLSGDLYIEQLYTFGDPDRDPRGRTISVAYYGLVSAADTAAVRSGDDASDARWVPLDQALGNLPLAFDHEQVLQTGLARLRGKLDYTAVGFELLPETFTLSALQQVYEIILGRPLDKRNFRRKIVGLHILTEVTDGPRTRGRLYRFNEAQFAAARRHGLKLL